MSATRPPKQPGNHHPTMSSNIMAISAGTSSEEPAPTGVLYILNALAFSTLLSSQETIAHRWRNLTFSSGATLKPYSSVSLVSTSISRKFPGSKPYGGSARHQVLPPSARWPLWAHARLRKEVPGGSPGPGPPSGVPSPSGQDELYG